MIARLFHTHHSPLPSPTTSLTSSHLLHLLNLCCNSKSLSPGKQTHQQIIHHSLHHSPFLLTKLVQFYADCNHAQYALQLFDELPQPNIFAWTAILALHSRNRDFEATLHGYCAMRSINLAPDEYVFPIVIRDCGNLRSRVLGGSVNRDVVVFGSERNLKVANALIGMYAKFGDLESARRVFDGMEVRDLVSWNSMVSGCVLNGFYELAVGLVSGMKLEGFDPDLVTLNSMIDGYCRDGRFDEALDVFNSIEEPNIISWTTLISRFSRIGRHSRALEIFKEMMESRNVRPDLGCLSIVMASSRFLPSPRFAREIHAYGIKTHEGCFLYESVGPALLAAYTRNGRICDARNVFASMDKSDAVTWNAMILGFVDLGMKDQALECFTKMQVVGVKCDPTTVSLILPICDLNQGKQVHAFAITKKLDLQMPVSNALICMYSRSGAINQAYLLFLKMGSRDLVTWNTMIGGFAMNGRGREALSLLEEMEASGQPFDSFTLTSVLAACSHSGLVDEGLRIFSTMRAKPGFEPAAEHVGCLVDMLARAGRVSEAVGLLRGADVAAPKQVWGALLAASLVQGSVEGAELAGENLARLEPENAGSYVALANVYAGGGRWEDGVEVRKAMEEKGVVKLMGFSRIEAL